MYINQGQNIVISSMINIYDHLSSAVVLYNDNFDIIWKNSFAEKILGKNSLDLVLSKNNIEEISNCIKHNRHCVIDACFLPFLGCKIDVTPIILDEFQGFVLIFEYLDNNNNNNNNNSNNTNHNKKNNNLNLAFNKADSVVSVLSSNLRIPIHIINNIVDVIKNDVKNPNVIDLDRLNESIAVISNNTNKMYRICMNLSELIRFSTNSNTFNKINVKISEFINRMIKEYDKYISLAGLHLIYRFLPLANAASWMAIDYDKINLAISNIILNSCQNSSANKNIFMFVTVSQDTLSIVIKDEGFGISKENIKYVFNPYTTFSNRYYVSTGIGIGLTLAKFIVNQHNGEIFLESEEDKGTTVSIKIPIDCDPSDNVISLNSYINFGSSLSLVAIQFSPILY